jgi:hypothetical protein
MNALRAAWDRTVLRLRSASAACNALAGAPPKTAPDERDLLSVAGEEDPGAALEFTRPGRTGPERCEAIRPPTCGR